MKKDFKYDLAISLCQQDMEFAKKLLKQLNPTLNIFFYEDRQHEIISKSGPEFFAKTFNKESRVVIILSRNEWSESYYTEIERNAIIDRTSIKNEGFDFLLIIPMKKGEIPIWYPSTRIYVDPFRFSLEQLAKFIEYKIADAGGIIKPLSVEDQFEKLKFKIQQKKDLIQLQRKKDSINEAIQETKIIKELFNSKVDTLTDSLIFKTKCQKFDEFNHSASFWIQDYELECQIPDWNNTHYKSTQDIRIKLKINQLSKTDYSIDRTPIKEETRLHLYRPPQRLWCIRSLRERVTSNEMLVLFQQENTYFDLINLTTSEELIENWFHKLLNISTSRITQYLN